MAYLLNKMMGAPDDPRGLCDPTQTQFCARLVITTYLTEILIYAKRQLFCVKQMRHPAFEVQISPSNFSYLAFGFLGLVKVPKKQRRQVTRRLLYCFQQTVYSDLQFCTCSYSDNFLMIGSNYQLKTYDVALCSNQITSYESYLLIYEGDHSCMEFSKRGSTRRIVVPALKHNLVADER